MMDKIKQLCEIEGYSNIMDLLEERGFDSVVPGICSNPGCDYSTEVEPDSDSGWCEECGQNTVKSALILAEVI